MSPRSRPCASRRNDSVAAEAIPSSSAQTLRYGDLRLVGNPAEGAVVARREGEAAGKEEEASPSREGEGEAGPSRGEAEEEAETCRDDRAATVVVQVGS